MSGKTRVYYDRHVDDALISTIRHGGALSWLIGHVRSEQGRRRHAHLQFRRDPKDRPCGSIQLYWGRTSPFEFRLRRGGRVRLTADPAYRDASKALFSHAIPLERLGALEGELRSHLDSVWELLSNDAARRRRAFVRNEAVCHAGMVRRYGHSWRAGDPMVAIDTEARIGSACHERRKADDAAVRRRLNLPCSESIPRKLDALGVLPTGDLALLEIKGARGSIKRAVIQVAVHALRFSQLMLNGSLRNVIQTMVEQKVAAGLVPSGCPGLGTVPRIVPCIAAPHTSSNWSARWRASVAACNPETAGVLSELMLVRLHPDGRILEVLR